MKQINTFRLYILLVSVSCLLIVAAVLGTYGANEFLAKQGDILMEAKVSSMAAQQRQASLTIAQRNIEKYEELEAIAKEVVPQEKDQARTVREIVAIAQKHQIDVKSIQFPSSALGSKTSKTKNNENISQLTAVKDIPGLYVMQINIAVGQSSYANMLQFISSLQGNRRTANITSVSVSPNSDSTTYVDFSLAINAYIRPGS